VASANPFVIAGCKGAREFMVDRSAGNQLAAEPSVIQEIPLLKNRDHRDRHSLLNRCFSVITTLRPRFRAGSARDFPGRKTR
jgi:hypothetical protein